MFDLIRSSLAVSGFRLYAMLFIHRKICLPLFGRAKNGARTDERA